MQFANQNHSGNAKEMASSFRRLLLPQKGRIEFSENERDMMINILKQNMSEEERKKNGYDPLTDEKYEKDVNFTQFL